MTHAWTVGGKGPTRVLPPERGCARTPAVRAGSGSVNSFHYQPEPDVWGGNLPKENCTRAIPRNAVCVICFGLSVPRLRTLLAP